MYLRYTTYSEPQVLCCMPGSYSNWQPVAGSLFLPACSWQPHNGSRLLGDFIADSLLGIEGCKWVVCYWQSVAENLLLKA